MLHPLSTIRVAKDARLALGSNISIAASGEVVFDPKAGLILNDRACGITAARLHMSGGIYTGISGKGGVDEQTATQNLGHLQVESGETFFNHTHIFVDDEMMSPELGQVFRLMNGTMGQMKLANVSVFSTGWEWKIWGTNSSMFIQNVGVKDPAKVHSEVCPAD